MPKLKDQDILDRAMRIMEERLKYKGDVLTTPNLARQFVTQKLSDREHEVFACIFLDNKHRVIEYEEMFRGTIDSAGIYPREVAKAALTHNAAAVIFAHNHPSGDPEPSGADRRITERLRDALGLLDIRTLDHLVVGGTDVVSFSECGYM